MAGKSYQAVVCSDFHLPFADNRALDQLYRAVDEIDPRWVVIAGDLLDCYSLSTFVKNPLTEASLQAELFQAKQVIDRLGRSRVVMLAGNHEARLLKYLWSHAQAFAGLDCLKLHSLLGLKESRCLSYGQPYRVAEDFIVVHGDVVRKSSGASAVAEMQRWGCSGVSGHTHRAAHVHQSGYFGTRQWIENGCLCNLNPEYCNHPDWQQAFTVLDVERGKVTPELVRI